jgi:DUF4097 and DUF4098 domain-containing protein YvlB
MTRQFLRISLAFAIFGTLATTSVAQQPNPNPNPNSNQNQNRVFINGNRVTVALTDPARPASMRIKLLQGRIAVKGTNRKDIAIDGGPDTDFSNSRAVDPPAGLRRLTQPAGFSVTEENNEVVVSASSFSRSYDLQIEVPLKANLELTTMNGRITVDEVEGELELSSMNDSIQLNNVAGSVVAHSMNGRVLAVLTRVAPQAAMAFTSMNGTVDVTLPASTKADLKLRSDQGDVFTDFDLQTQQSAGSTSTSNNNGRVRLELNRSITGTINGGGPDIELRTLNGRVILRKGK